jgi:hypothetical protein
LTFIETVTNKYQELMDIHSILTGSNAWLERLCMITVCTLRFATSGDLLLTYLGILYDILSHIETG